MWSIMQYLFSSFLCNFIHILRLSSIQCLCYVLCNITVKWACLEVDESGCCVINVVSESSPTLYECLSYLMKMSGKTHLRPVVAPRVCGQPWAKKKAKKEIIFFSCLRGRKWIKSLQLTETFDNKIFHPWEMIIFRMYHNELFCIWNPSHTST